MSLERNKNLILKQISELKEKDKIIVYNNPNRFCRLFLERTNPTHIGYVWGLKTRKERKKHGKSIIRVAKIYFCNQILFFLNTIRLQTYAYIDYFLNQMPNTCIGILCLYLSFSIGFYYVIFKIMRII